MKHKFTIILALCALLAFAPGCSILAPQPGISYEASVYRSFEDVWTVTKQAYTLHLDRVAAGKVTPADAADVARAWENFRSAYLIALDAARMDQTAFTPARVRNLADDVLTLIGSL
jgi:hypothetical protein